ESVAVTLLGGGSRLLAQTRSATITRAQVQDWVVEGFLPPAQLSDPPARRQGALRGLGLPYPADAAITRHLAQFLARHAGGELPDTLLLNGGVFHAHALVQRLGEQLQAWRGAPLRVLHNPHPDWAVARGAAAHGLVEYQQNHPPTPFGQAPEAIKSIVPRIGGGSARSYWLLLPGKAGAASQGLCLLPRGTEEGTRVTLSGRRFALQLGQPVRFALLARSQGQAQAGQIGPLAGEGWVELPPLSTVLPAPEGRTTAKVEVQLQACMSEVGVLELRCVDVQDAGQSWLLSFAVRAAGASPHPSPLPEGEGEIAPANRSPSPPWGEGGVRGQPNLDSAITQIDRIFGNQTQDVSPKEVRQLRATLEKTLGAREAWPMPLLRALFDALLARAKRRRRSPEHERTWLNLAGWCLRPGLGAELDAWRLQQLWQLYAQGLGHAQEGANWTEWWVLWRRVAAGLNEAQQMQVLEDVAGCMQKTVQRSAKGAWGSYDDMLRLFAAMEAVPWQYRQEMGQWMLERLKRPDEPQHTWWAIGRLAARVPLAANAHLVMPPHAAQEFLDATLAQDWRKNEHAMFAAVQIARMTGERTLDLSDTERTRVLDKLRLSGAPERWLALVAQVQELSAEDRQRSLGDSLPPGLVLVG
ncbi:MAG: molecular chaperone DnaK, partial [Proteobacteria bacterium]|nr:molecular chaperone DnaK [Pseudomonadota bacterium]